MRKSRRLPVPPDDRVVLSITEGAGLLGVGESTLRDLVRAGKIPHTRLGKRILLKREVLLELANPAK